MKYAGKRKYTQAQTQTTFLPNLLCALLLLTSISSKKIKIAPNLLLKNRLTLRLSISFFLDSSSFSSSSYSSFSYPYLFSSTDPSIHPSIVEYIHQSKHPPMQWLMYIPQDENWGETTTAVTNVSELDYAMEQCVTVPKMLDDTDTDTFFRY